MSANQKKKLAWGGAFAAILITVSAVTFQAVPSSTPLAHAVEGSTAAATAALNGQLTVAADLSEAFHYVAEQLQPSVVRISSVTRPKQIRNERRRQANP